MHNNRVCISVTGTTWHDQWARNLQTPAVSNSCQASWLVNNVKGICGMQFSQLSA